MAVDPRFVIPDRMEPAARQMRYEAEIDNQLYDAARTAPPAPEIVIPRVPNTYSNARWTGDGLVTVEINGEVCAVPASDDNPHWREMQSLGVEIAPAQLY